MDCYSPKHVERILKIKSNHKKFVHLIGLYTYCRMMHGAYSVKLIATLEMSSVLFISFVFYLKSKLRNHI
jgi:hypothetical protein